MSVSTHTGTFEHIKTGRVGWAITPRHSTEPAIENSSELIFYRKLGAITIPQKYDVLYARFPGDSNHNITLRLGGKPILKGMLEITGPRNETGYRRFIGDDPEYLPTSSFTRIIGDNNWEWELTGSWLNAVNNPGNVLTLPQAIRHFPDIEPFDPASGSSQVLLALAKSL